MFAASSVAVSFNSLSYSKLNDSHVVCCESFVDALALIWALNVAFLMSSILYGQCVGKRSEFWVDIDRRRNIP